MIVKNITKKVDIPHEPGEWMMFKRLTWRQLEEASDVSSDASFERMKKMGAELLSAIAKTVNSKPPQESYDKATILHKGIIKWSYPDEVNKDNIDALDDATVSWAFAAILALNEPTEREVKNA